MKSNKANTADFKDLALSQLENLYRTASYVVQTDSEAQDLVQDSLLTAYRSWPENHSSLIPRVWLFKILASSYVSKYRPFPDLTAAINSADNLKADADSTQAPSSGIANNGDHYSVANRIADAICRSLPVFPMPASHSSLLHKGNRLRRAPVSRLNDAINSAFEFDGTWTQAGQQLGDVMNQEFVYSASRGSNYEIETNGHSSNHVPTRSLEKCNFNEISGEVIKRAIHALPDELRLIVVLSLLEDFTHKEIADIVGVHLETVKFRLPRGRRLIREDIESSWMSSKLHDDNRQSQE